jgi:23S rRNA (uracil1939-C5)-methyltransferase
LLFSLRGGKAVLARGEKNTRLFGAPVLREQIGGLLLEFPLRGFAQTNSGAAALLYAQARELAALSGRETVWEFYAGAGALGLFLADQAAALLGVEIEAASAAGAQANAKRLGFTHCRFMAGDAVHALATLEGRADLRLVDPPRAGLPAALIKGIRERRPPALLYVSCDPATLARDLAALAPQYRLEHLRAVDMFPHTPHIESVALLRCV